MKYIKLNILFLIFFLSSCINTKRIVSKYNQVNNGHKEGIWITLELDGKIKTVYQYKKGVLNGTCTEYNQGSIKRVAKYKNGKLYGVVKIYDDYQRVVSRARYKNDSIIFFKSYNYY